MIIEIYVRGKARLYAQANVRERWRVIIERDLDVSGCWFLIGRKYARIVVPGKVLVNGASPAPSYGPSRNAPQARPRCGYPQLYALIVEVNSEEAHHSGTRDRIWKVTRTLRNLRGVMAFEYRCTRPDSKKNGRIDCYHMFADKLRRGEVVVIGKVKGGAQGRSSRRAPSGAEEVRSGWALGTHDSALGAHQDAGSHSAARPSP